MRVRVSFGLNPISWRILVQALAPTGTSIFICIFHLFSNKRLMMRMEKWWIVILVLLVGARVTPCAARIVCSSDDSGALLHVKESIISKNTGSNPNAANIFSTGTNFSSWQQGSDCCASWDGIECDRSTGAVIGIEIEYRLDANDVVVSKFSPSVCDLRDLQKLTIISKFQGLIPKCIWAMAALQELSITGVSSEVSSLSFEDAEFVQSGANSLLTLTLQNVGLVGELPTWFGDFPNLSTLYLSENYFTYLPESLANLTRLHELSISYNNLVQLPRFLSVIPESLDISSPRLLPSLEILLLDHNQITSFSASALPNVSFLDLGNNNLSRIHLDQLDNLKKLDLSSNLLTDDFMSNYMITSRFPMLSKLALSFNYLKTVPKFLTNCPRLESIHLAYNWISDSKLSEVICSLSNLKNLFMVGNNLGEFSLLGPSCNLSRLIDLDLGVNRICSFSLGNVSSIASLQLNDNRLGQGSFDVQQLSGAVNLIHLNLGFNEFTGKIPSEFVQFTLLRTLLLTGNQFTSEIPEAIGNMTSLIDMDFSRNQLTGHMPQFLTNLTIRMPGGGYNTAFGFVRVKIMLHDNQITGNFPEVFHITCQDDIETYSLILDLSNNLFTASTRSRFLPTVDNNKLYYLFFSFSNNMLTGDVSDLWSRKAMKNQSDHEEFFAKKYDIDLSSNKLSRSFDFEPICSGPFAAQDGISLDLSDNELTGSVPEVPRNCSFLLQRISRLKLARNRLQGQIPKSLGMWTRLDILSLAGNQLQGKIPPSLGNCTQLIELDLSENHLNGTLPPELGFLTSTRVFTVAGNNLEGDFPLWITGYKNLMIFDISRNNFGGIISDQIDFTQLRKLSTKPDTDIYGRFSGDTSRFYYGPKLTVHAKGSAFSLMRLDVTYFGIANNRFYGSVPLQLGQFLGLHLLDLSGNQFNGSIPEILGKMKSLQSVDLSDNQLTGPIPDSFAQLTFLSYFNVTHNQLSGRIPSGQMLTFDASFFEENAGLCGVPLPECTHSQSPAPTAGNLDLLLSEKGRRPTTVISEYISLAAVFSGFALGFAGITLYFWLSGKLRFLSLWQKTPKRIYMYDKPYGAYIPRQ